MTDEELSPEQIERINFWFTQHTPDATCPVCQKGRLLLDRQLFALIAGHPHRNPSTLQGTGKVAIVILLSCTECGFVRMHTLRGMGLEGLLD